MSSRQEYNGKIFLAVPAASILVYTELQSAVFIFLPKNGKMVRVRDAGQFFDSSTIELYQAKGHNEFYILDPNANPGSYASAEASAGRANPPLPAGYVPLEVKEKAVDYGEAIVVKTPAEADSASVLSVRSEPNPANFTVIGSESPPKTAPETKVDVGAEQEAAPGRLAEAAPRREEHVTTVGGAVPAEEKEVVSGILTNADTIRSGGVITNADIVHSTGEITDLAPPKSVAESPAFLGSVGTIEERKTPDASATATVAPDEVTSAAERVAAERAAKKKESDERAAAEVRKTNEAKAAKAAKRELLQAAAKAEAVAAEAVAAEAVAAETESEAEAEGAPRATTAENSSSMIRGKAETTKTTLVAGRSEKSAAPEPRVANAPTAVEIEDAEEVVAAGEETKRRENRFGTEQETQAEKRFSVDHGIKQQQEIIHGTASEREVARTVSGDVEESADELTKVKGWAEENDKAVRRIQSDIETIEAGLTKVKGGKEFIEELQKISAGEEENTDEGAPWQTTLSADSPRLRGLDPSQAATVKLSFAVNKRLGQLRGELNQNTRFSPDAKTNIETIRARREALREEVRKHESLLVLLEALDDDDMEPGDLPPELRGKEKIDLVRFVSEQVEELKGSKLLQEGDSALIQNRIEDIKAKSFQVYGEGLTRAQEKLAKRVANAAARPIEAKEAEAIRAAAKRELQNARASANIASRLTDLRTNLSGILAEARANANPERSAERERKAMAIQASIRDLENLALEVDAGLPEGNVRLASFLGPDDKAETAPVENDSAAGLGRLLDSLSGVKEKLIAAKKSAADADSLLRKRLDGDEEGEAAAPSESIEASTSIAKTEPVRVVKGEQETQAEFKTLVSGQSGKELQAGVYAAAFFQYFGYRDEALEKQLVAACYLFDAPDAELAGDFPDAIRKLHRTIHAPAAQEPMAIRDLAQAARMARAYNEMPGVVTGKFAIDPVMFSALCDKLWTERHPEVDLQLVERARQRVAVGQSPSERERLVDMAKAVTVDVTKWRQSKA